MGFKVSFFSIEFTDGTSAETNERLEQIMATQTELANSINQVAAQVTKIGDETRTLLTRVAELTTALEEAGHSTPEVDTALAALQEQVAVVDALVPDTTGA